MNDETIQVQDQIFRLVYVVRNAACHRSLSEFRGKFHQNYWILIFNNFLDIAVLEWCKVFGSYGEHTHWTKLVEDEDAFRCDLFETLGLSEEEWKSYWEEMKSYRDSLVAHHQRDPNVTNYPTLDYAIEACIYYYEFLIKKLRASGIEEYPEDLRGYYEQIHDQAKEFSAVAYRSTLSMTEAVK